MNVKQTVSGLALFCMVLLFIMSAGAIEIDDGKRIEREEAFERSLTGLVEKIPEGVFGTWKVKGEDVLVPEGTHIEEEDGLLEEGAVVEVKGRFVEHVFTARKVRVKKGKVHK